MTIKTHRMHLLASLTGWLLQVPIYFTIITLIFSNLTEAQGQVENIDAYNLDICGQVNLRPWQTQQSAFGCMRQGYREMFNMQSSSRFKRRRFRGQQFADGMLAKDGELPFLVQLKVWNKKTTDLEPLECGGTLIHIDLVLTSASCVAGADRITGFMGNNKRFTVVNENRSVNRFCLAKGFSLSSPEYNDMAILRLWSPLKLLRYDPFKIAPACLALSNRHTNSTICSMTGMGRSVGLPEDDEDLWRLMIQPVQRLCDEKSIQGQSSCYLSTGQTDSGCPYHPGASIVCYDKCGTGNHRAFVVGVMSKYFKDRCAPGKQAPMLATDLNWQRQSLLELIYAVRQDEQEEPIAGVKCEEPW